jgi:hypothetical protein
VNASDDAREVFFRRYRRDEHFTPDDYSHVRRAQVAACDALTAVEDFLEYRGVRRDPERARVRELRRVLECQLFP